MAGQVDPRFDLAQFKHSCEMTVRFADLDMLAHVNHTRYLTYMEQGRIAYATDIWDWNGEMLSLNMIVANIEVNYLAPLVIQDKIEVWTRISRLGTKSFDFLYVIKKISGAESEIVATGKTAMVAYDYATGKTIPINSAWRDATLAYEPGLSSD